MAKVKTEKWSRKYTACKECRTTVIPHVARGLCKNCYAKEQGRKVEEKKPILIEDGGLEITLRLPAEALARIEEKAADKLADRIIDRMKGF